MVICEYWDTEDTPLINGCLILIENHSQKVKKIKAEF